MNGNPGELNYCLHLSLKKIPSGVEHADTLKSHSISLGGNQMYGHMLLYMNIMVYGRGHQT